MTEAARLSVAVEVTGEEDFKKSMSALERATQKAKASVDAAASGMGKDLAQLDAVIAKSVGGLVAAIDRQTASIGKGFAQVSAQMRQMQTSAGTAASSIEKDAGRSGSAMERLERQVTSAMNDVRLAMGQVAPASAAMASDIGQSSQAMASFEAAAASMNAATANLQGSIRDVSAAMAKFNSEASKPANDNPYDKPARGAATLRAELNPLFAIGEQYHAQVARIRQAHTDGAIGAAEMAMALQRAGAVADASQRQYLKMDGALGAAGGAARLTSFQMTNLGYQVNDIGTMLAMGASPFQIIASQAGQVVQALGDNPQGVGGSLRAIGSGIVSFARAIPTAGYAVAGLTAAVAGVYALTRGPQARSAEESVGSFEEAVRSLQGAWSGAGDAAEEYFRRAMGGAAANTDGAMLDVQARLRELRADYEATIRSFNEDPSLGQRIAAPNYGGWSEARHRVRDLYRELLNGTVGAREMADEMTRIAIDANVELATRGLANGIRELLPEAIDLEARIASISETVDNLAGRGARVLGNAGGSTPFDLRDRFGGGVTVPFDRLNPEGMATIRDGLRAQREEIEDASKTIDKYADSLRSLRDGWAGDVEALRLQVRMHGETEGAVAAARYQYEALAEARRLAADNEHLFDESGADAMRIREVAAEIGNLTDQLAGMKEAEAQAKRIADALADLQFQGSIIGLSEVEQNVSRQLHQLKLDTQSVDGQRIADAIRYNATLEETEDRLEKQRDLVENIASSLLDIFTDNSSDSFFDRITDGLAPVSAPFTNDLSALFREDAE